MSDNEVKDSKYLKVDINALKIVSDELKAHNDVIEENLLAIGREFAGLKEYFNTKTGIQYQELMNKYLTETTNYINSKNGYLVDKFNQINSVYRELYDEVKKDVQGTEEGNV